MEQNDRGWLWIQIFALVALFGVAWWFFRPAKELAPAEPTQLDRDRAEIDPRRRVETKEYVLYVPETTSNRERRPLVIALSQSKDGEEMLLQWRKAADARRWYVYSSKSVRVGESYDKLFGALVPSVRALLKTYAIDDKKIVAAGWSAGAMAAEELAHRNPELIGALVVNSGAIGDEKATLEELQAREPKEKPRWPRGKLAVFLAGEGDARAAITLRDRKFLDALGWRTERIEFTGADTVAPAEIAAKAAEWIDARW